MAKIEEQTRLREQVDKIEEEIRRTPYHKATEHYIGRLRAKLSKLKAKQLDSLSKRKAGGGASLRRQGYAVKKQGDATIVLVGPPSVGKSTLLNTLTNAKSKIAPYEFSTVSVIPGMMKYKDANIQILDVPGLIEGAEEGKGRGRELLSVARGADLLIIMCDVNRAGRFGKIQNSLEKVGIRINQTPPDITIEKKVGGGIFIHSNIKQNLHKETIKEIAGEFGYKNAEITIKERLTMQNLLDAFSLNRVYIPAIFIINKSDLIKDHHRIDESIHRYRAILLSAEKGLRLSLLKKEIWKKLKLVRVYLVRKNEKPNLNHPIIMKSEDTLKEVAKKIGEEFAEKKKRARIWSTGSKFPGQEVSLGTKVKEGMQVRFI